MLFPNGVALPDLSRSIPLLAALLRLARVRQLASGEVLFLSDDLVSHLSVLTVIAVVRTEGMCVVHTPSPCAMVARRCTWVPMSREMTSVSASHS